jgi:hypothetical protein
MNRAVQTPTQSLVFGLWCKVSFKDFNSFGLIFQLGPQKAFLGIGG